MLVIKLIVYTVCAYALGEMMVFGRGPFGIFTLMRKAASRVSDGMGELFGCMLCLPMWIGMVLSVLNIFLFPSLAFVPSMVVYGVPLTKGAVLLSVFVDGLFTSGSSWLLYQIECFVENIRESE